LNRLPMIGLLLGLSLLPGAALAVPLDKETCTKLKAEHLTLTQAGIKETMAKGPEWAASNLSAEQIGQIKRFLSLEEDIRFRCDVAKARPEAAAKAGKRRRTAQGAADAAPAPAAAAEGSVPAAKPKTAKAAKAAKAPAAKED
jgi:hypothetical protein